MDSERTTGARFSGAPVGALRRGELPFAGAASLPDEPADLVEVALAAEPPLTSHQQLREYGKLPLPARAT